jgi:osomolarity two-component system sensor histidine kinase NIK1
MSSPQELHRSVANVIRSLAKQHTPADGALRGPVGGPDAKVEPISLEGPDSEEKASLERDLAALAARLNYLEAKAKLVDNHTFPITPGEPTASQFIYPSPSNNGLVATSDINAEQQGRRQSKERAAWVSNWLASRDANGDADIPAAALTEEQLNYLRDHLNKQADQIKNQREHIDNLSAEVNKQLNNQSLAFEHGIEDIGALKRELGKHQQANLAFQKALREIGNIVTAVAMGDLSKKVLIHAKEMDPEIMNFKRTINKMVDQLQEFASQVTFLAKEVGTEGRLGGQANLPGVDGIWAELTDSGMSTLRIKSRDLGYSCP